MSKWGIERSQLSPSVLAFGDLEASRELGMQQVLIRSQSGLKTIIELAEALGC